VELGKAVERVRIARRPWLRFLRKVKGTSCPETGCDSENIEPQPLGLWSKFGEVIGKKLESGEFFRPAEMVDSTK
jgi:hypothetical protein